MYASDRVQLSGCWGAEGGSAYKIPPTRPHDLIPYCPNAACPGWGYDVVAVQPAQTCTAMRQLSIDKCVSVWVGHAACIRFCVDKDCTCWCLVLLVERR